MASNGRTLGASSGLIDAQEAHFLGLDLSTQQLKAMIVDSNLKAVGYATVGFDKDFPAYKTEKGVYNKDLEVQAPVAMWLEAIDLVLTRLKENGADLARVRGISGACQQHGSVFWGKSAVEALSELSPEHGTLKDQLRDSLAWQLSPNWQDHSTEKECKDFEAAVGGREELASISGSCAHRRFTGPQILRLMRTQPDVYASTDRIALVSSFTASVFAGKHASIDIGDVCGMNLWDIGKKEFSKPLVELIGDPELLHKLGPVDPAGGSTPVGRISTYFVEKYGFSPQCLVLPFTGDNPGTILALPLDVNDVIVSLGTSTTALVVTENYVPSPMYHLFSHPVGRGYMGMLCYCNGALARERVRDQLNAKLGNTETLADPWAHFSKYALSQSIMGNKKGTQCIGFYFPLSEIIPERPATLTRVVFNDKGCATAYHEPDVPPSDTWAIPEDDALRILESQALSIRYRLMPMLTTANKCPRRVYYVGGSSRNDALCTAMSRVLVPADGAYRLDLSDACAKGAAHKAAFGALTAFGAIEQSWEDFIVERWADKMESLPFDNVDHYGPVVENLFSKAESQLPQSN
jgi:xylulokinase